MLGLQLINFDIIAKRSDFGEEEIHNSTIINAHCRYDELSCCVAKII